MAMQIPANSSLMSNPQAGNPGGAANSNRSPSESGAPGNPEGPEARGTRDAEGTPAGGDSLREVESSRPVEEAGRSETENRPERDQPGPAGPQATGARPEQAQERPMDNANAGDAGNPGANNSDDPRAQRLEQALERSGARDGAGGPEIESSERIDLEV